MLHQVLTLVPKDKRSCFSQGERSAVQLPLDCVFTLWEVGCLIDIWKPATGIEVYVLGYICNSQGCGNLPCEYLQTVMDAEYISKWYTAHKDEG